MLILTRKKGESLMLGDDIEIKVTDIGGDQVRIGVSAPAKVKVYRKELYATIRENQASANTATSDAVKSFLSQMK